ncbi:hypothetical protein SUDANB1_05290 [Streptomyces sp. enrichment culture]|uniref:hypothetical protein n=1 Tax=Streptomyces sp. enrichment culture TaxID=1795815 RepID=UPI003F559918
MNELLYSYTDPQGHRLGLRPEVNLDRSPVVVVSAENLAIGGEHVTAWLPADAAQRLDAALAGRDGFEHTDQSGDRLVVAPAEAWTTFEITRAEDDDEPSATVRAVVLSARLPEVRRSLAALLGQEPPTNDPLATARSAAAELLRQTTGSDLPEWRATFDGTAAEPNAIAPICTDPDHVESEDPSAFGCCPEPIIPVDPPLVDYLVALLNADRERGESA